MRNKPMITCLLLLAGKSFLAYAQPCQPVQTTLNESICQGTSYQFGIQTLYAPGTYQQTFNAADGCDSTVTLHLSVELLKNSVEATICKGHFYQFGPQVIYDAGTYQRTFTTPDGCDSLVTLTLHVEQLSGNAAVSICKGQSYAFGPQVLYDPGVYQHTFTTPGGCDSLVTLTLSEAHLTGTASATICKGQVYDFGVLSLYEPGVYQQMFTTPDGCDSLVTLTLQVYQLSGSATAHICKGESYQFGLQTIYNAGTYAEHFTTPGDCDSLVTLTLTTDQLTGSASAKICAGDAYIFNLQTLYAAGTYQEHFTTPDGCDSLVTLTLEVEPSLAGFPLTGDTILCAGEKGVLRTVNSYAAYKWSTGVTTPTTEVGKAGWVAVTVTSALGCTAINSIYVFQKPIQTVVETSDPTCFGDHNGAIDVTVLDGPAPFQFSLNTGPDSDSGAFLHLPAGNYTLTVRDANGCTATQTLSLLQPPPLLLDPGGHRTIDDGVERIMLQPTADSTVVSWLWTPAAGLSCTDCSRPLASPDTSTTYTITVADIKGCTATATLTVLVNVTRPVYVPNAFSPNDDGHNDYFTVFAGDDVAVIRRFEVFDRWGNCVFAAPHNLPPGATALQWNGYHGATDLPPGVYGWYLEVAFSDGNSAVYRGGVTLVR